MRVDKQFNALYYRDRLIGSKPGRENKVKKDLKMKTIQVERSQIETAAKKLAEELGGKMYNLKGLNGAGKIRGIAIIPANVRGSQFAAQKALAVVSEA